MKKNVIYFCIHVFRLPIYNHSLHYCDVYIWLFEFDGFSIEVINLLGAKWQLKKYFNDNCN